MCTWAFLGSFPSALPRLSPVLMLVISSIAHSPVFSLRLVYAAQHQNKALPGVAKSFADIKQKKPPTFKSMLGFIPAKGHGLLIWGN